MIDHVQLKETRITLNIPDCVGRKGVYSPLYKRIESIDITMKVVF